MRLRPVCRGGAKRAGAPGRQRGAATMGATAVTRIRRGFVHGPDGDIEYIEVGSGPPLVLLHGTPMSAMSYRHVAPLLADAFRVVAMTTVGYGQSDRPDPPYTTLEQFARSVTWLMDGLGIDRAHVDGNRTGSEVAAVLAAGYPERVDRLILEEIFNWSPPHRRAAHERLHRYIEPRPDGGHLLELWRKVGGDRPGADLHRVSEQFMDNLIVNSNEGAEVYGGMGWDGAGPYAMTRHDIWETTPLIQAPTLV
ncbi:MAG: alpha/beta hydrolase, partial [Chloroflexi bacterium]|nr:alpha/beta hydrolase [Chloroflexota bacterium]